MTNIRDLDPSASPLAYYGAELRRLREAANLNQKQLGAILYCTGSLIGQIETARKLPTREFSERVDAALGTEGSLSRLLPLVLRSQLPPWFQQYAEMEARASYINMFQTQLVLGLLQTEEYARAVLSALVKDRLDERVAARMERQRILKRENPPLVWVVLCEAVLHQGIGGRRVMRNQLAHLLSYQDAEWVQIQVLPFSMGVHAGLMGSFTVFRFDDDPDITYTEGYEAGYFTADPKAVKDRALRYDHLQAAALSVEKSAELIARVMEELYAEPSATDGHTMA
ncbi:helix-turn-helix transcriptional regulator [Streptomyces sp. AK02-01A]|uniref:helix-turn-helix domain-containing protein n=1 Tax=Streptomyces sp. AK02-01A TaxID=3028648 RepID=UPI0029A47B44|nr:helix-turn-helix transcriptional regulator [Streptomyces sp. AK02-01A]MDX3849316.1 helix-turn-helix transcriptional regulator [Streptomyces sp. AK02-01A]